MSSSVVQSIAFLFGGAGLFLLGMRFMSDGLQTIAGPTLKKLIGKATNHRILGVAVGFGVTCLVQSSAVTMAMVIGFVNAEMMLLPQAIGVIIGANIGTTITGWVLALNIDQYGLPLAGACALVYCFAKKERVKYTALAFLGVGLVFIGLFAMKGALSPFSADPQLKEFLSIFQVDGMMNILVCVIVGFLLAAIMQSSTASLGVTIALAYQGLIGFETSAALVLGQNIGCTVSSLMISIRASRHSKRAAFFHLFFNVFGVIWVTLLFSQCMSFMHWFLNVVFGIGNPDLLREVNGVVTAPYITIAIASFHTLFNLVNAIILLPFVGQITNLLEKMFTHKATKQKMVATKLDFPLIKSPFAAITQSTREMVRMGETIKDMMANLRRCFMKDDDSKRLREQIFADEERLDMVQTEVINFLTELLSTRVSQSIATDAERQLRMSDDLETASDYIAQLLKLDLRMGDHNVTYDETHQQNLLQLHDLTAELVDLVGGLIVNSDNQALLVEIRNHGVRITQAVREFRSSHWNHLAEAHDEPLVSTTYTDMLGAYRKIKEHLVATAETIAAPTI